MILKLHAKHVGKYKKNYPLLFKEALIGAHLLEANPPKEGQLLKLVDEHNHYIATAYYGLQNKGIGWVLSRDEKEKINPLFFKKKIYIAFEKRLGLYNNPKTNCFRVFNGEGDGIGGLSIDFLNGYYLINWYSEGIYHFRDEILDAIKTSAEFDGIYEKLRFDAEATSEDGFVMGTPAPTPLLVKENDVTFAIRFDEGAMVGIFLDQRDVRRQLKYKYSKGKTVLNTFAYTGAFSVFAALGGAKQVFSVDLANRTTERVTENFNLNKIDPEKHPVIIDDVFNYFNFAKKKDLKYDVVILDPPSFAKSKDFTFSAEKDYPALLAEAIRVTSEGGVIVASNNSSTIDLEKFKQIIGRGFNLAKARFQILEIYQLPKDFRTHSHYPESEYLKVVFIRLEPKKRHYSAQNAPRR